MCPHANGCALQFVSNYYLCFYLSIDWSTLQSAADQASSEIYFLIGDYIDLFDLRLIIREPDVSRAQLHYSVVSLFLTTAVVPSCLLTTAVVCRSTVTLQPLSCNAILSEVSALTSSIP